MSHIQADLMPLARPAAQLRSAGWFLRRALFGTVILTVVVMSSAILLHASIDQETASAVEQNQSE